MNWKNPPPPPPPHFSEVFPHNKEVVAEEVETSSPSVSDQRTLYLVNIFILHTARFLNRFSALCNEKLAQVHRRMRQLDASLVLLEAQVSSIGDWIDEFEPEHNVILQGAGPSNKPVSHTSSSVESSSKPFRAVWFGLPFSFISEVSDPLSVNCQVCITVLDPPEEWIQEAQLAMDQP